MDTVTVDTLAQALQEPKRALLLKVLRTLGQDRCVAILADTLQREATGGMLTRDGTRRRTPGGVFFQLVKDRVTPHERRRLFPRPVPQRPRARGPARPQGQPQAPTWDEVRTIIDTLPQGEATVTLTLTGRPDVQAVHTRPTNVAFRLQGKEPDSLPKGLPPVPGQGPITWLVILALRQWTRVQGYINSAA
jgi:hypothetical protein